MFAGRDGRARGEGPFHEVAEEIRRQKIAVEAHWQRAGVVQFNPWIALTEFIHEAVEVGDLEFVQPQRIERLDGAGH